MDDERIERALALLDHHVDADIERDFVTIEERILAQALENVERAERRLREIQELIGDRALVTAN
jgi:hypothetical protein